MSNNFFKQRLLLRCEDVWVPFFPPAFAFIHFLFVRLLHPRFHTLHFYCPTAGKKNPKTHTKKRNKNVICSWSYTFVGASHSLVLFPWYAFSFLWFSFSFSPFFPFSPFSPSLNGTTSKTNLWKLKQIATNPMPLFDWWWLWLFFFKVSWSSLWQQYKRANKKNV